MALVGVVALLAAAGFQRFGTSVYSKVRTEADHVTSLTPMEGASNYCFGAGTLVLTPNGQRRIEEISVGDAVLSHNEESGELVVRRATQTFVTPHSPVIAVSLAEHETPLHVTPGHLFLTRDRGWVAADRLVPGEPILSPTTDVHVAAIDPLLERETVYNFEVQETHTYFVGAPGALVHNPMGTDCNGNPIPPIPNSTFNDVAGDQHNHYIVPPGAGSSYVPPNTHNNVQGAVFDTHVYPDGTSVTTQNPNPTLGDWANPEGPGFFQNSNGVNAPGSTFNDVGGSQFNHHGPDYGQNPTFNDVGGNQHNNYHHSTSP